MSKGIPCTEDWDDKETEASQDFRSSSNFFIYRTSTNTSISFVINYRTPTQTQEPMLPNHHVSLNYYRWKTPLTRPSAKKSIEWDAQHSGIYQPSTPPIPRTTFVIHIAYSVEASDPVDLLEGLAPTPEEDPLLLSRPEAALDFVTASPHHWLEQAHLDGSVAAVQNCR